jgi:hypothetical protein
MATAFDIKSRKPVKWRRVFQPSYHVARFILIGLYTGTRHEANLSMRWGVDAKGGSFDLDRGVMYRRGDGEADSNKASSAGSDTWPPCAAPETLASNDDGSVRWNMPAD